MRRLIPISIITYLLILFIPAVVYAEIIPDAGTVRLILTAPDNQDFSMFDQESLVGVLIEIIENDPDDAAYHQRVVSGALIVLGGMHVPEAVDVLIENLEEYTTTCLFWLGTYASVDGVAAMIPYLENDDASIRYETAAALAKLPEGDIEDEEWTDQLSSAIEFLNERIDVEDDEDVIEALEDASGHITEILSES